MATIFIILFIAAVFHFIYESILLPMFRLELRYSLFNLRDELRNVGFEENTTISKEVFNTLDEAICTIINRLPSFNMSTKTAASREYETNSKFKNRVEHSKELLSNCEDERISKINDKLIALSIIAITLNSGGWLYVVLPVLIVVLVITVVTRSISSFRKFLVKEISNLTYASEKDFNHFPSLA